MTNNDRPRRPEPERPKPVGGTPVGYTPRVDLTRPPTLQTVTREDLKRLLRQSFDYDL